MKKVLLLTSILFFINCMGYKYTEHTDLSLQNNKLQKSAKFVVLPLDYVQVTPPPGMCFKPKSKYDGHSAARAWTSKIRQEVTETFPQSSWVFPSASNTINNIRKIAERASLTTRVDGGLSEDSTIFFMGNMESYEDIIPLFENLNIESEADYGIVFIKSSLSGETHTTVSLNFTPGGFAGGGASSETYYNAQIEIQLWDCKEGRLLFNTGTWNKSTNFCFFQSPEDAAMDSGTSLLMGKLKKVISLALQYHKKKNYAAN